MRRSSDAGDMLRLIDEVRLGSFLVLVFDFLENREEWRRIEK
ncbi:hypothetical protein LINPERHAP1_LOCUS1570 [Linum perenne]